jgi:hypothetical protein
MRTLALALALAGCGSKQAPPPPQPHCDGYMTAVAEAERTPAAPGDSADVMVVDACGCGRTVTTTAAEASRVTAAHDAWTRDRCGPVNCDEPCPTPAPR